MLNHLEMEVQPAQEVASGSGVRGKKVVMRKIPLTSRVRKRLFSDEQEKEINLGCATFMQDEISIHAMKWNFDFEREVPMEGPIKWYRKEGDTWFGMLASGKTTTLTKGVDTPDMNEIRLRIAQSRARRKLIFDEIENANGCGLIENALNKVMEETHQQKKLLWNFDFQTEEPLEGPIQWFRKESGKGWVAMMPVEETEDEDEPDTDISDDPADSAESTVEEEEEVPEEPLDEPDAPSSNDSILMPNNEAEDVEMMELPIPIENQNAGEEVPPIDGPMASAEEQNQQAPRDERAEVTPQIRKRKREAEQNNTAKKWISSF